VHHWDVEGGGGREAGDGTLWWLHTRVPVQGWHPDDGDHACFIPKRCVHRYTGHTKGVSSIDLSPTTGHLLLSASMDTKVKVR
jgi:WD40 repeat protein